MFDKNEIDFLVLPLIAGLDSIERSGRLRVGELREDQVHLAVTVLYTLPGQYLSPETVKEPAMYRPGWFQTVLRDNPVLVADVLQRCVEIKHQTAISRLSNSITSLVTTIIVRSQAWQACRS